MLKKIQLYYFSPTGGTKKVGDMFCNAIAEHTVAVDLMKKDALSDPECDTVVFALPVFGGRIPLVAAEKIASLVGDGKKAVVLAVYGVRAYEDALLELKHIVSSSGFGVVAGAALVARHSIVSVVGEGRPNEKDAAEIAAFASNVEKKLLGGEEGELLVPGNEPYRERSVTAVTPMCFDACTVCGKCAAICPVSAIRIENERVETNVEDCIFCMACVGHCPQKARGLALAVQEKMNQKLSAFTEVYRENEFFL
ncbi:MAG: EFR1 family ferrodoxin [Firmicutes bacterium]|nr:EFR1 family ferrodoxin [Bacillota bacterium]